MASGFLAVVCFCLAVPMATGLRCIVCTGISTNGVANACADAVTGATTNSRVCSEVLVPSGQELRCSVIASEASGGGVTAKTTTRACSSVAPSTANTCTDLGGGSVAGVSASGKQCYCKTDNCNGQTTLAPVLITCLVGLALALYAVI